MPLPQSDHFTLVELADGVYMAHAAKEGGAFGNAGIIDLGDAVLLFDSCVSPQAARDLYDAAVKLTGYTPSRLVISHAHIDHYQGACGIPSTVRLISTPQNQLILQHVAACEAVQDRAEIARQLETFVAQLELQFRNTGDEIKRYDTRFQIGYIQALLAARNEVITRVPDMTFEKSQTFNGNKRTAVAMTYGGGHSPSDVILYLPDDHIIYMGDLISVQHHPFLGSGNLPVWLHILDEIDMLSAQKLIPGHGSCGTLHDLHMTRYYIDTMIKLVEHHIQNGGTTQTLNTISVPKAFCDWYFASWNFPANLNTLFAQKAPKSVTAGL